MERDEGSDTEMLNPRDPEMHDSVTGPIRSQDHDSSGGEAHGAEYLHENVKNPLRQPSVCSQLKERLALPEHDGSFGTQNEARTMKPEGSSEERSILWEKPKRVSQDPVGEESVAYEEAYPEPVGREVGHNLVDQERTDTGSTYVNIVDHALRDPEQRDGTGMERTSDPLSPRMASTSEVGERIRAIAKVPPDDDPDQSRREADGVPRGITIPGDRGSASTVVPSTSLSHAACRDRPSRAVGNAFSKRRTISDSFDCIRCVYLTDHAACGSDCGLIDITYTACFQRRSVSVVVRRRSSGVSAGGITTAGITPVRNAYHRLFRRVTCASHMCKARDHHTPTPPMVDSLAASNEESISLSSDPRSRLLHGDVSSATLSAREKGDDSGAALGCKPLSPLTGDVSPVSEDDDETEIETVRMEPDRVAKPAAVESDTDDGASSITDVPCSSPLAHRGRRIRQTSIQRAPTPAIPKTASRLHPHVVKRDRCAEGSSQIEWPGDAIRASYGKFGLDVQRLLIVPEAQPFNPLALFMSSAAKVGAKLTPQRMKVLQKRRDELLASLPAVDDLATGSADIDLIKGLCNLYSEPVYPQDMMDLIRALRQRQKVTKDAVNLLQCLESFALVVTKYHAQHKWVSFPVVSLIALANQS
ncbi:hypothetical protein LTS02_015254 [Friedmanniomyces endolithicus]|nr:hypothetical protein LTS02_015254 [Friedmanniomyces endolithicus]